MSSSKISKKQSSSFFPSFIICHKERGFMKCWIYHETQKEFKNKLEQFPDLVTTSWINPTGSWSSSWIFCWWISSAWNLSDWLSNWAAFRDFSTRAFTEGRFRSWSSRHNCREWIRHPKPTIWLSDKLNMAFMALALSRSPAIVFDNNLIWYYLNNLRISANSEIS